MLKDYYNEIIPPWDPRYGKLGHIWKKYEWNDFINKQYYRSWNYFDPFNNKWISSRYLGRYLNNIYLTTEDYFDLFCLNINSKLDIPKCNYNLCTNRLKFISCSQGYSHMGEWDSLGLYYCSNKCQRLDHEYYNKLILDGPISTIKRSRQVFIVKSNSITALFYITRIENNLIKYGITTNINNRIDSARWNGCTYICPHIIIKSTVEEVANIEARLKLKFDGYEYLEFSKLHEVITELKLILRTRPVLSPFT